MDHAVGAPDGEREVKVGEAVANFAHTLPFGGEGRGSRVRLTVGGGAPIRGGQGGHATQKSPVGPAHQPDRTVRVEGREDGTHPLRLRLPGHLHRIALRIACGERLAVAVHGAQRANGIARGADRGTQVHHRLGVVARTFLGRQIVRRLAHRCSCCRHGGIDGTVAGEHALHVAVHHHCAAIEGDGGDRCGGVGADARQFAQGIFRIRKAAERRHRLRAGLQVARPGIVAEARPFPHHLFVFRRGQIGHGGPAAGESLEIGFDGGDPRLLQHDFRQPHPVGVGRFGAAGRHAPGQVPRMAVVPGEQSLAERFQCNTHGRLPCPDPAAASIHPGRWANSPRGSSTR